MSVDEIPNRLPPPPLKVAQSVDDVARWATLWLFVPVVPFAVAIVVFTLMGVVPR